MKIFIFDDECAYIGSANITSATHRGTVPL
ncbi:MAG: hypothetical protein ILA22_05700 [Prevotella sp.]|nr:hypothetical protein [Prevotella sp.]